MALGGTGGCMSRGGTVVTAPLHFAPASQLQQYDWNAEQVEKLRYSNTLISLFYIHLKVFRNYNENPVHTLHTGESALIRHKFSLFCRPAVRQGSD